MRKTLFILIILIFALSWALEFNISVNYKLNVSIITSTKAYPLTMSLLVKKGYINIQKHPLYESPITILNPYRNVHFIKFVNPTKITFFNNFIWNKKIMHFSYFKLSSIQPEIPTLILLQHPMFFQFSEKINKKQLCSESEHYLFTKKIEFPKVESNPLYRKIFHKTFIDFKEPSIYVFEKPKINYSFYSPLPVKNFFPISQKRKFLFKNSTVAFNYGNGYDFYFSVPFPLKMNYNGTSLEVLSEYGKLTMQSSKLYYSYSLFYNFSNNWSIKADIDLQSEMSDALISYDLNDWTFSLGMKYNFDDSSLLPLGRIFFNNSYLSLEGTTVSIDLAIPDNVVDFTYHYPSFSLSYSFTINNWRFEFGYDKDINFVFSTGFNYYIPIDVSFGYKNSDFFINTSAIYSDFNFGFDGLKKQAYIKINKNL